MSRHDSEEFQHRFESLEILDELLELLGCPFTAEGVIDIMRAAQSQGQTAQELIPELFPTPPRFPSPEVAKRFFQNMLGLWDLVVAGQPIPQTLTRPARPAKPKALPHPGPFTLPGPSAEYVESVMQHLNSLDRKERNRLIDRFENRQDSLLQSLEEIGVSDEAYAVARDALFRLFALLELGWPSGVKSARLNSAKASSQTSPPDSLVTWLEALIEQQYASSSSSEKEKVRLFVTSGLSALWNALEPGR